MKKVELLLPAGDEECLRAAVTNGADAVYVGLGKFNARMTAANFDENNLPSVVEYCHKCQVKIYVVLNTLVKNHELNDYMGLVAVCHAAGVDAIIIQDPCLISLIKNNFPGMNIHLSTQATITNSAAVPSGVERVILPRELSLEQIKAIASHHEAEVFVHGALCLSYSGQCLFSSFAGGRSGNRGYCAQPCRQRYNNKYPLSTMDLCSIERIPEIIEAGVYSLKIEGRMRSALYVATVAKIYRKAIDSYYAGKFNVEQDDINELKLVFNREFTTGFAFNDSVTDSRMPMNRGLFLGIFKDSKLSLRHNLSLGDGVSIWIKGKGENAEDKVVGYTLSKIMRDSKEVKSASRGDIIEIPMKGASDGCPVYKTSDIGLSYELGEEIKKSQKKLQPSKFSLPEFKKIENQDSFKIFVKAYNKDSAALCDKAKADVIYYDCLKDDFAELKTWIKNSKLFAYTPRIIAEENLKSIADRIKKLKPDGVLVGDKGLLPYLEDFDKDNLHLDYSFNIFNDIDLSCNSGIPIISPELNLEEVGEMHDKRFIALAHGDVIVMTTKEPLKCPELVDEDGRHFKVRKAHGYNEILNSNQLGLFNHARLLLDYGVKYFLIDTSKDPEKYIRIYRKILSGEKFDDKKIKKGYTLGHLKRGVA